ncbi:hypothetical protein [Arthrobacter sp. SLBN-53]|uniref:hypothetical protein n=1 Tax=Arthrobacter sp. SLBN-53 TaxID=2768412 RepID=UPI001173D9B1|nr:hypothetical protein [Arthrobacter sp. SLBN-53]TQK30460.1 hypothetical protein FBY28_3480 [Arthrobacter sp. SLBN-53]
MRRTAMIQLGAAVCALVGCVLSWLASRSDAELPPVLEGEPTVATVIYYPPLILLALLLATVAGVLTVLGIVRLRASRT